MTNDFQYRLQKSMSEIGMTATDLSVKTGIDKGAISNYINGKYIPKQDKCYALALALGVDPGWLMTGDEPVYSYNKIDLLPGENKMEFDLLLHLWRSASSTGRDVAMLILNYFSKDKEKK